MDERLQMYKELTELPGAPGHEKTIRKAMERYIRDYADELSTDNLGGLIARIGNRGPKIMVAAHLDEVAFIITSITQEGFLKFLPLGGWWNQVMLAQRVTIHTKKEVIDGVIGSIPPHVLSNEERRKPVELKDMFIDIGATSREEVIEFGVSPGDIVIPVCPFTVMKNPKVMMAKAWDNRVGIAIIIELFKRLRQVDIPNRVFGVGTIQEELGMRGAKTAAYTIEPDICIAVDVGVSGDTPNIKEKDAQAKLGKGPLLLLCDSTMIAHPGLLRLCIETAGKYNIPFQYDALPGGGTDAGRVHLYGKGVPSIVTAVPARYIHSHASLVHQDDIDNTVNLLVEIIKGLDEKTVSQLKADEYY
ncbi:M42 family metallopeptidase [Aneurinibacillus thermoaerophilus]|uniref:M42 family metallopeptidase n=1 Tax=Aneurinibacillus thermoaerophilus TaxID=143495 RepID=UPI002E2062D4|nr:M42 family metallopeptidase [Aneurinibacillus thermoaerophilus]MED0736086.1 M42 family metallopeptidase [Aneurinibacillus thermoaerophilus]MED0765583.1 M42 family metallopeptidase [Aneurinibacillus thermoaerophilus]